MEDGMKKESERTQWSLLIEKAYVRYQLYRGADVDKKDFARWLGIQPPVYSQWVGGDRKPTDPDLADMIAGKLELIDIRLHDMGIESSLRTEVYTALGISPRMPRNPELQAVMSDFENLPSDLQDIFARAIRETAQKRREEATVQPPAWFQQRIAQQQTG
jgi:hypothetical protein